MELDAKPPVGCISVSQLLCILSNILSLILVTVPHFHFQMNHKAVNNELEMYICKQKTTSERKTNAYKKVSHYYFTKLAFHSWNLM